MKRVFSAASREYICAPMGDTPLSTAGEQVEERISLLVKMQKRLVAELGAEGGAVDMGEDAEDGEGEGEQSGEEDVDEAFEEELCVALRTYCSEEHVYTFSEVESAAHRVEGRKICARVLAPSQAFEVEVEVDEADEDAVVDFEARMRPLIAQLTQEHIDEEEEEGAACEEEEEEDEAADNAASRWGIEGDAVDTNSVEGVPLEQVMQLVQKQQKRAKTEVSFVLDTRDGASILSAGKTIKRKATGVWRTDKLSVAQTSHKKKFKENEGRKFLAGLQRMLEGEQGAFFAGAMLTTAEFGPEKWLDFDDDILALSLTPSCPPAPPSPPSARTTVVHDLDVAVQSGELSRLSQLEGDEVQAFVSLVYYCHVNNVRPDVGRYVALERVEQERDVEVRLQG